jgi:hypothetical protein
MHPNANVKVNEDGYIIFSCSALAFIEGWMTHRAIDFKIVDGCYKGQHEQAYITNAKYLPEIAALLRHDQESILALSEAQKNGHRAAKLIFLKTGNIEKIGVCKAVDQDEAEKHDAWTYRPDLAQYFICE